MHLRMIWAIAGKDVREAIRDGRVLLAIVLPIALGVSYNLIFDEAPVALSVTAAYAAAGPTQLPDALREKTASIVDLELIEVADAATVRRRIAAEDASFGFVVAAGFDQAVAAGATPEIAVLTTASPGAGSAYLAVALDEVIRDLAGQPPPASVRTELVPARGDGAVFERVGLAPYFVVTNVVFVVLMISLFVVPVILTEESERRTLDALTLVASYLDVIAAKALVGLGCIGVAVGLLLGLTRVWPAMAVPFVAVVALLSVALIGVGLLLGGLFRSVTQLNTWSSLFLLPFALPIFVVGLPVPSIVERLAAAMPTGQATRLALEALAGERLFDNAWLGYGVIAVWGVVAYALLLWRLRRREG